MPRSRPATTFAIPSLLPLLLAAGATAQGFQFDWQPNQREVVLDTDDTTITTTSGAQVRVRGGIFVFRNVTIPANVSVRVVGSNPLVIVTAQRMRVDGTLDASGRDGQRVDTLQSPQFPSVGGPGGPAAGRGGNGSPVANDRSPSGQPGFGPGNAPNLGGGAGLLSCTSSCNRGSAGGGGSFTTAGDLDYLLGATPWTQVTGRGGEGCINQSLPGGAAGPIPFGDGIPENDFWGLGYDVNRGRVIRGELQGPLGGSGGGGGGDRSSSCRIPDPLGFVTDNKGGGGGGGGGAAVLLSFGTIEVGPNGRIAADGGHGGGGEQAGGNNQGAGGGGGSGGMLVLAAAQKIQLNVRGGTYAGAMDSDFVLSADGGVGLQGPFGGVAIADKYPTGSRIWAQRPTGGFGGLGLIQLVAPVGDNADGTNTVLDDGIEILERGQVLTGVAKAEALGWRGYPDAQGQLVDDFGLPTDGRNGTGEMRPSPVLLPYLR